MADQLPDLLTSQEAAALLRCTRRALEKWRARGTGPRSVLIAGRRLYPRDEIAKYVRDLLEKTA